MSRFAYLLSIVIINLVSLFGASKVALAVDADRDGYHATVDCNDADSGMYPGRIRIGSTYYSSLQSAVNAATSGAAIAFCGKFTGGLAITGKTDLTLFGYDSTKTKIVNGVSSGIRISSSTNISLVGFRINDNDAGSSTSGDGGGVHVTNCAGVWFSRMWLLNNYSSGQGGGIYINNSTVTVADTTIENNDSSNHGGGVYIRGVSMLTMLDSELLDTASHHGLYIRDDSGSDVLVTIYNVLLEDNVSDDVRFFSGAGYNYDAVVEIICTSDDHACY